MPRPCHWQQLLAEESCRQAENGGRRCEGRWAAISMSDSGEAAASRDVAAQGGVVASMTALSRISGLLRDIVLSHVLGATGAADTFFLAFRIPNFFRRLFAEGAFAQAFVPVLAEYRQRDNRAALKAFLAAIGGNLGVVLLAVTVAGVVGAWALVAVFMFGFFDDPPKFALAVDLTRIMFPYLALISLTAFAGAVLNASHRYAVPAFTPVLLNASLIAAALWAADAAAAGDFASVAYALAWGVFAAGVAQFLFQLPSLARVGLLTVPKPDWRHAGARKVGRLVVPAAFAASAGQVNALIGSQLASLLEEGSVSWLYYADRLMELPIGIVAIALGTVLLPTLSRLHSAGKATEFNDTLDWGLRIGLLLGVPAAAALALLAHPLLATLFQHGEMQPRDVDRTAAALRIFAIGLVPLVLVKIAAPGYFSRQDTTTPLKFAVASVATNIALGLATFWWLGHVGLALATSMAAIVNAGLLIRGLIVGGDYRPGRPLARAMAVAATGTAIMVAALWLLVPGPDYWLAAGLGERIGTLALAVLGGLAVYTAAVYAAGVRPRDLRHRA